MGGKRLSRKMALKEVIVLMGEGVPGAIDVCYQVWCAGHRFVQNEDASKTLARLDVLGIYGTAIWELYKSKCNCSVQALIQEVGMMYKKYMRENMKKERWVDENGELFDVTNKLV